MLPAKKLVEYAAEGSLIGTPYKEIDCQALIEVLHKKAGDPIKNYRGSNHMWREMLTEKHIIDNVQSIPPAAMLFTIKKDGGEIARGYRDSEGNASHIGLYLGHGLVIHSTTGGVQWDDVESKRWTHWGLSKHIDYSGEEEKSSEAYFSDIFVLCQQALRKIEERRKKNDH